MVRRIRSRSSLAIRSRAPRLSSLTRPTCRTRRTTRSRSRRTERRSLRNVATRWKRHRRRLARVIVRAIRSYSPLVASVSAQLPFALPLVIWRQLLLTSLLAIRILRRALKLRNRRTNRIRKMDALLRRRFITKSRLNRFYALLVLLMDARRNNHRPIVNR